MELFNLFKSRKYSIKDGYHSNKRPQYYFDNPENYIYQPDVYELAYYLGNRGNAKYIIDIGSGNGAKLKKFVNKFEIICVDFGANKELIGTNISNFKFVEANLEMGIPLIDDEILSNSIVIMSDVIEHIVEPHKALAGLCEISYKAKYLLVSTPERTRARGIGDFGPPLNKSHVREWSIDEFDKLLKDYKFREYMIGYTINTNFHMEKNNIMVISGKEIYNKPNARVKVLAVINMYNEIDIIEQVINHLINNGINVHVTDNWSDDGSYELVQKLSNNSPNMIFVSRFPDKATDTYEWEKLLKNTERICNETDYDWYMHYDCDEFRESPWKDVNLLDAISFVDGLGYNAIDFTVIDFRPVCERKSMISNSIMNELVFFEFGKRPGHFIQVKCWKKKGCNTVLSESGGHEATFKDRKIYPIKFINRHYPIRNREQAIKKIFKDRKDRFSEYEKRIKGWHTQYDSYSGESKFLWKREDLICWRRNNFDSDFLVERISGIGIVRDKNQE